jgi:hypothetical protein
VCIFHNSVLFSVISFVLHLFTNSLIRTDVWSLFRVVTGDSDVIVISFLFFLNMVTPRLCELHNRDILCEGEEIYLPVISLSSSENWLNFTFVGCLKSVKRVRLLFVACPSICLGSGLMTGRSPFPKIYCHIFEVFFIRMDQWATCLPRWYFWRDPLMNEHRRFKAACPRFTNWVFSK